jgi:hypothetical protein
LNWTDCRTSESLKAKPKKLTAERQRREQMIRRHEAIVRDDRIAELKTILKEHGNNSRFEQQFGFSIMRELLTLQKAKLEDLRSRRIAR